MSPRTPEQNRQIRNDKQDLLKSVAMKLFAVKGYHETSISQIAKEAGISKGLLYNYYQSKEDLLVALFSDMVALFSSLLNPDNDNEITGKEMSDFFDKLIKSLDENRESWILFYQLSMQPVVLELMLSKIKNGALLINYINLLEKYFEDHFDDPEEEYVVFSSMIKGFFTIYLFNPESVPEGVTKKFKARLRKMFIREKKYQHHK
jgi:AcrR family transcriptional regulator